jgi:hypothetical protein
VVRDAHVDGEAGYHVQGAHPAAEGAERGRLVADAHFGEEDSGIQISSICECGGDARGEIAALWCMLLARVYRITDGKLVPDAIIPVVLACLKAYTAVLRSLHAFDLIRDGCSARVCKVSTVISTSSGEVTALIVAGPPVADASCGGVKGPFALIDIDACALLRLRFAMVADVVELLAQARESLAIN